MVTISIPQLDTLNIKKPTALPENDWPDEYTRTIVDRITTYQAPPSCRRLPLLSVGLKQFLECQESIVDGGRLRYMPSPNNLDSEFGSEDSSEYENDFEYDSENDFKYEYNDSDIDFLIS